MMPLPSEPLTSGLSIQSDGQLLVRDARENLFNDVPGVLADLAVAALKPQSRYSAETPCGPPAWSDAIYDRRRAYVLCNLDKAVPPIAQEMMIKHSGVQWDVETFNTGHAPFLSQPKRLSAWTIAELAKFQGAWNDVVAAS